MGRKPFRVRPRHEFDGVDRRVTPKFRYRVRMQASARVRTAWATNEKAYAVAIAEELNAIAGTAMAWVEAWDQAHGRGQWLRI